MKWDKERALEALENGQEAYAWLHELALDETFAFVVIYRGRKREGWWVDCNKKVADPDRSYFESVDELENSGPTVSHGCSHRSEFPTAEQAVDFALSCYGVDGFTDYQAINDTYLERYVRGRGPE